MTPKRLLGSDGRVIVAHVETAASFPRRFMGLMGRRPLGPGRALRIISCRAVHTFFMRFALDLVFLDRNQRVIRVIRDVRPWRAARGGGRAESVMELEAGWLPENAARVGEIVFFDPPHD